MKKLVYKIYNENCISVRQNTTTVNLEGISDINIYSYADKVLRERFKDYSIKINHAGKTISIKEQN